MQDPNVLFDIGQLMLLGNLDITQGLALDDILGIAIRQLGCGPKKELESARFLTIVPDATHLIIVRPNHFLITRASSVMVNVTEKASLSSPGTRLQSSSLKVGGSMGTARWTR